MYMTGFADEAAADLTGQIRATKELGWNNIDLRSVNGKNIHDISDAQFEKLYAALSESGIRINCLASTIAGPEKNVDEPVEADLEILERLIPRLLRLETRSIRIMSYAVIPRRSPEDQKKEKRFEKIRIIVDKLFSSGIRPLYENGEDFGGMGWSYTLELLDNIPGLRLVFNTGNPLVTDDRTKNRPFPAQSPWEFYSAVKNHIDCIRIKDAVVFANQKVRYTYPAEGTADVRRILADLISSGFDGGISIEPHMKDAFNNPEADDVKSEMYASYVEYGRRVSKMLKEIKGGKRE